MNYIFHIYHICCSLSNILSNIHQYHMTISLYVVMTEILVSLVEYFVGQVSHIKYFLLQTRSIICEIWNNYARLPESGWNIYRTLFLFFPLSVFMGNITRGEVLHEGILPDFLWLKHPILSHYKLGINHKNPDWGARELLKVVFECIRTHQHDHGAKLAIGKAAQILLKLVSYFLLYKKEGTTEHITAAVTKT